MMAVGLDDLRCQFIDVGFPELIVSFSSFDF